MRITNLKANNIPPLRQFEIADMGGVVVIAGANGSGKTRLKEAIINTFKNPNSAQVSLTLSPTRPEESSTWETDTLIAEAGHQNPILHEYMNSRTRGGTYVGSVIQIDSDRSVQSVKFEPIAYATPDPFDTEIPFSFFLNRFNDRWNDLVNKIYQKAAARDRQIAQYAISNPEKICSDALTEHPDPFLPYQEVFSRLLSGKVLEPIDPKQPKEFHYRVGDSDPLPFKSLGSGEQEVIKIAFNLIWKKIKHCIVLVDEPELHCHPTLTFRLIETLKDVGDGTNQFIFFTHSADLVSTYYTSGNVYFIDQDETEENQARNVAALDSQHSVTASRVAANLGLFAVGKNIIFIEGVTSSVDRLIYHKICQLYFPEAYLFPLGSVENISALHNVVAEITNAIFGIGLFMIRDRDGLTDEQVIMLEANNRMRCLKRRHIENYLLDDEIISRVAEYLYLPSEKQDRSAIEQALLQTASDCLKTAALLGIKEIIRMGSNLSIPTIREVESKEWSAIEQELVDQVEKSRQELGTNFSNDSIRHLFTQLRQSLETSLKDGTWKTIFPGKILFSKFCGDFLNKDSNLIRQAYVDLALQNKPDALEDIRDIFEHFKNI